MKRSTTYESFEDLAIAMTDGKGMLHIMNCPGVRGCIDWQNGVIDFAAWLDYIGVGVNISDESKSFYEFMRKKDKNAQAQTTNS